MDEKPKRRWFRFRLSTVLILTAIVAWAMATRPHVILRTWKNFGLSPEYKWFVRITAATVNPNGTFDERCMEVLIPAMSLWPAIALAAFLAWKAAWALGPRIVRRRPSAAPE
jgi:hypothetical protein